MELIKENWREDVVGNPFITYQRKLENVKKALAAWSKETFSDTLKQIASLEDVIKVHEVEFDLHPTAQNRTKLHKVQAYLTRYIHLEEEFWRQKLECNGSRTGTRIPNSIMHMLRGREKSYKFIESLTIMVIGLSHKKTWLRRQRSSSKLSSLKRGYQPTLTL